jgi:hypothetical protein
MLMFLAIVLLCAWLLGFLVFKVSSALIHLLLLIAAIVVVYRLVTGRKPV